MKSLISSIKDGYSPLGMRNFRIYVSGQALSMVGTWMQMTAQSWVVWELTHSELKLGIVAMLGFIPFVILGPWSGVWADIVNRRKLLIGTQVAAMILAIIFAVLVQTHSIQIWHIYLLSILLGIVNTLDMPAQSAFIGDLSGMEHIRKAVAVNSTLVQISRMLGPALAGWVIAAVGVAPAFWLNALSFVAVILSLVAISSNQEVHKRSGSHLNEFWDGMKFIYSQPRILDLMLLTLLLTFFAFSAVQIMPAVATDVLHGDARVLGNLLGAAGAGALLGSMVIMPLTAKIKKIGLLAAIATAWTGLWFVVFAFSRNAYTSMLFLFLSNLLAPLIFITTSAVMQSSAPPNMRARLMSALLMIMFGIQPFASIFIGFSASRLGSPLAIMINGALMVAGTAAILVFRPKLRRWEVEVKTVSKHS
ncbi:MFS transporter [Candidatus Woesearchaeota archaeon]|nr:MFS transporter [Candidatus Woesearchaeota archaeon]